MQKQRAGCPQKDPRTCGNVTYDKGGSETPAQRQTFLQNDTDATGESFGKDAIKCIPFIIRKNKLHKDPEIQNVKFIYADIQIKNKTVQVLEDNMVEFIYNMNIRKVSKEDLKSS